MVEPLLVKYNVDIAIWGHIHVRKLHISKTDQHFSELLGQSVTMFSVCRPTKEHILL